MKNIIPVKSSDIEIVSFDNGGFLVIHQKLNYRLNVNKTVINLLGLVDGKRTIDEIYQAFIKIFKKNITIDLVYDILFEKLGKYHIIENKKFEYLPAGKPDYLKLSTTILKKHWVFPITKILSHLYAQSIFYPVLIISSIFVFCIGIFQFNYFIEEVEKLHPSHLGLLFLVSIITLILHELGHASACRHYGAAHGNIGFGFYLLSPVMYADVSDIWKLKRKKRIVVNLAGIYMQMLISSIFGIVFLITRQVQFLAILYFWGITSVFINLNPFLRTDGYWILSDIIGISNLRKKSNTLFLDLILWALKKKEFVFNKKNILLLLYASFSIFCISLFLGIILWNDSLVIFSFPKNLFSFSKELIIGEDVIFNIAKLRELILPALFYVLVIKLFIQWYNSNHNLLILIKK